MIIKTKYLSIAVIVLLGIFSALGFQNCSGDDSDITDKEFFTHINDLQVSGPSNVIVNTPQEYRNIGWCSTFITRWYVKKGSDAPVEIIGENSPTVIITFDEVGNYNVIANMECTDGREGGQSGMEVIVAAE